MKKITKKYFNLIELSLAIGILAIGATAVLALFPVGLQFNRDSVGENYCSIAAANFFAYIQRETMTDWDVVTDLPGAKPTPPPTSKLGNGFTLGSLLHGHIYEATEAGCSTAENEGVFGVKIETGDDADSVVDFTGEVLIWRSPIDGIAENIATRLNLEISWPLARPYLTRNENYYCLDLYNNSGN